MSTGNYNTNQTRSFTHLDFKERQLIEKWLNEDVNLNKMRKEQLFIQFLEGIHWTEAEVICLAKDRKLQSKFKSVKEDLVREAFPGLLPAPVEKPKPTKKSQPSLKESPTA